MLLAIDGDPSMVDMKISRLTEINIPGCEHGLGPGEVGKIPWGEMYA